jgi:hypothetical protein
VTDDYWGPTGVWVVRETVRNAFDGDPAVAESLRSAVDGIAPRLPVSTDRLRRASELVAGVQSTLGESVA